MIVPFPKGIQGISSTPKKQEYLINQMWTGGELIRTPGIQLVASVDDNVCRGAAKWYVDENLYMVIGGTLYRINSDESVTSIGAIGGISDVVFSQGQINLVIVVKGGNGYLYNETSGLSQIVDTDYLPSDSVDFIDGRHVFIPSSGEPAFYSDIDNPNSINPLSFFDAEELPDLNKVTINIKNNLYIGGSESFEIYRTTGAVTAPFQRREGARIDVGYVSGLQRYLSSFMFIGRNREENYAIHIMAQGETIIASNDSINEILNTKYADAQLKAVTSYSYNWKGRYVVGWNLPEETIEYVDGNWIYRDSNLDGTELGPWRGKHVAFAHGRYYVGDRLTGMIGKLVDDPKEYGRDVEYEIKTFLRAPKKRYFSISECVIDCLTGLGPSTIGLSVSSDGRGYSDYEYRSLGEVGEYNTVVQWAGGLGQYESFMGLKVRGTGSVVFSAEMMELK